MAFGRKKDPIVELERERNELVARRDVLVSSRPPAGSGVWLPGPRELSCRAGSVRAFTVPLKKTYFCDPHHIFPIPLRLQ